MLGSKKDNHAPVMEAAPADHTIIGGSMVIKGDITSNSDIRVNGEVNGNITTSARLVLGNKGVVKGNIKCKDAEIHGTFLGGKLEVEQLLTLKGSSKIEGEITLNKLATEIGAVINGNIRMGGTGVMPNATQTIQSQQTQSNLK